MTTTESDTPTNGEPPRRTLLSLTRDLFFEVRISAMASRAGWHCVAMQEYVNPTEVVPRVRPDIILVEQHAQGDRWLELIHAARTADHGPIPVIAFGSHMDLEARDAALAAGAATVVANSRLSRDLLTLLNTYAPSASTSR